jgi:hypothetical protein
MRASGSASPGFADSRILAAFVSLAASLWAFWPTLGAYYFLDDYAFVAISRYTDHPLYFYLSEHFPGGFFYRPSGMLLWWLTAAGDLTPQAQFALNWLLLGCASVLLGHLLSKMGLRRGVAVGASLVFALHPIAVTTAGWLSNRFDLVMTIGFLLALIGTVEFERNRRVAPLLVIGFGTLLAVTSKELGFVTPIGILALAGGRPWKRIVTPPVLISGVLAAGVFVVRSLLLPGTERILYPNGMFDAAGRGTVAWTRSLADFLVFVPDRPGTGLAVGALAGIAIFALAAFVALRLRNQRGGDRLGDSLATRAIVLGTAVFVAAALVQSPTVARSTFAMPTTTAFSGEAFFAGRFYYLALIGLLIAVAGIATALPGDARVAAPSSVRISTPAGTRHRGGTVASVLGGVLFALLLGYWGWQSRVQGKLWAAEASGTNRAIAEAAAAAVRAVAIDSASAGPCRIYLLETIDAAPRFWPFSDTIVKAVLPEPDAQRLASCLISTARTPWYHVVRATADRRNATAPVAPFQPICLFGKPFPSLSFDSVEMRYLAYPRTGERLVVAPGDRVFRFDRQARNFDDVTTRVAIGDLVVGLQRSRSAINACPDAPPPT